MNDEYFDTRSHDELVKIIADLEANAQIRESDWRRLFNRKNELEAENERLRAENNWIIGLREGMKHVVREYVKVLKENKRLRAELARIKPSWNEAPEWATALQIESAWTGFTFMFGERHVEDEVVFSEYIRRPEDK